MVGPPFAGLVSLCDAENSAPLHALRSSAVASWQLRYPCHFQIPPHCRLFQKRHRSRVAPSRSTSMTVFQLIAMVLTITALFSYVNFRFIKLPTTIGVMLIALLFSLAVIACTHFGIGLGMREQVRRVLEQIDFDQTLMQGMLSFMLFAGALHLNLN